MEPVKLQELIPEEAAVILNGKTYALRKVNLKDEVWMLENYGREKISAMIAGTNMALACALFFRVMKDKTDFIASQEDGYDDNGLPAKVLVTGVDKIMRVVIGTEGKNELLTGVYKVLGISNPKPDDEVKTDPKQ